MAVSANCVWRLRTGGSDTNGGGFVTGSGGTDYSQQDAPQLAVTDAACAGTTTLTSATGGFTAAMIGSIVYLSSGPGWYQITARADTNTVTIDRAGPSASGMTANVGGAFASVGQLGLIHNATNVGVSTQKSYIKSGTYTFTSTTANVSGGRYSYTGSNRYYVCGYDATDNDDGTPPVLDCAALTSLTAITSTQSGGSSAQWRNIAVDGQGGASNVGFSLGAVVSGYLLRATDCSTGITAPSGGARLVKCYAEGSTGTGFNNGGTVMCRAKNCALGFGGVLAFRCVATGGATGFDITFSVGAIQCVAYGQSGSGFDLNGNGRGCGAISCVAVNCGAYGFDCESTVTGAYLIDCAGHDNTSGNVNNPSSLAMNVGFLALTGDPFNDAASDDFTLNDTAGAGAALREAATEVYGLTDYTSLNAVGNELVSGVAGASGDAGLVVVARQMIGY